MSCHSSVFRGYAIRYSTLAFLGVLIATGCESATAPPPEPAGQIKTAIKLDIDMRSGTVRVAPVGTTLTQSSDGSGPLFALFGENEISARVSGVSRSAIGAFTPNRVRVRFDLSLSNKLLLSDLVPSTFPAAPAGVDQVVAFPFATDPAGLFGLRVRASSDWDGTGAAGSGAPHNFFNDGVCIALTPPGDCFRWEAFGATIEAGATTADHLVGFDVDPTVATFSVYVVVAADLRERQLDTEPVITGVSPSGQLATEITVNATGIGAALTDNVLELVSEDGSRSVRIPILLVSSANDVARIEGMLPGTAEELPAGRYRARVTSRGRPSALSAGVFERVLTPFVSTTAITGGNLGGIAVGSDGTIFAADRANGRILRIDPVSRTTTIVAGSTPGFADGDASSARFNGPTGIAIDDAGALYVADQSNHRIRKIENGQVSTLAGNGEVGLVNAVGAAARFHFPRGLTVGADGMLYVADVGNDAIRRIDRATGAVSTTANLSAPTDVAGAPDGRVYAIWHLDNCRECPMAQVTSVIGGTFTVGIWRGFGGAIGVDADGTTYVTDQINSNIRIVGSGSVLAGGEPGFVDNVAGPLARFGNLWGVAPATLDDGTKVVYVTDGDRIRRIQLAAF